MRLYTFKLHNKSLLSLIFLFLYSTVPVSVYADKTSDLLIEVEQIGSAKTELGVIFVRDQMSEIAALIETHNWNALQEKIRNNSRDLIKTYHPDRSAQLPSEFKNQLKVNLDDILTKVTFAKETLEVLISTNTFEQFQNLIQIEQGLQATVKTKDLFTENTTPYENVTPWTKTNLWEYPQPISIHPRRNQVYTQLYNQLWSDSTYINRLWGQADGTNDVVIRMAHFTSKMFVDAVREGQIFKNDITVLLDPYINLVEWPESKKNQLKYNPYFFNYWAVFTAAGTGLPVVIRGQIAVRMYSYAHLLLIYENWSFVINGIETILNPLISQRYGPQWKKSPDLKEEFRPLDIRVRKRQEMVQTCALVLEKVKSPITFLKKFRK